MTKTAVVALGGNALTRVGQSGTCDEMLANAAAMASAVHAVIEAGWRVVVVHGNGPQVGNLALQQEATAMVPPQPLPLLSAMTQGLLGSLLARAIDLLRGPGTAVAIARNSPRTSAGASGFMSQVSRCPGPPGWKRRMHDRIGCRADSEPEAGPRANAAARTGSIPSNPNPPARSRSRRLTRPVRIVLPAGSGRIVCARFGTPARMG